MIWPWFLKKFWWAIDGNENWIFVSQNVSTFKKIKRKRKKAAELSVICLVYRVNHTYVICMQCILCTKCAQMSFINPRLIVLPIYFVRTRFIYSDMYTIFQKQCNSNTNCVRFINKPKNMHLLISRARCLFLKIKHNPSQ